MPTSKDSASEDDNFVLSSGLKWYFTQYGQGPKTLIAFHGYGQDKTCYRQLAHNLGNEYTLYSFDLPYHGQNLWNHTQVFLTPESCQQTIQRFIQEKNIQNFSLLGFSIGCKIIFGLLPAFASRIPEVFLIAPDGIRENIWYKTAMSLPCTSYLLKKIITHPGFLKNMAFWGRKTGLLSVATTRFALGQLRTPAQRQRLLLTWLAFKKLRCKPSQIAQMMNEQDISMFFFAGRYDRIVSTKKINYITRYLKTHKIKIFPKGHTQLINAVEKWAHKSTSLRF